MARHTTGIPSGSVVIAVPEPRREDAHVTGDTTPETRYARTSDGVSLAYHTVGDGPVDLLWLHAFMGGLEVLWESEVMRSATEQLASFARVIRHDMRATGLSGRASALPDLETQVRDIAVVLDAVGSRSTVILGSGPGAHLAALFAATFPERTRAAVLWDLFAWTGQAFAESDLELVQRSWGTESAAAASMARVAPSMIVDRGFLRWLAKVHRHFVPPDAAAELMQTAIETDVRPVLPTVHVPTLVLARHWPGHEHDREIASQIEGASFVLLDGEDRATFAGDTAAFADAIRSFVGGPAPVATTTTQLRAVLFTDIVGSTEHLAAVGDKAWRDLIVRHDERSRVAIEGNGGRWIKSTGDGVLATFEGPAQAIHASRDIGAALTDLGVEIRAGVHVGEIETFGEDVTGVTVNVAARIGALAGPSEIWTSSVVRDLTPGSGLAFEEAGEHELKGVPDRWRLYRVGR
jgi:class 3 adenylate cyclase